MSGPSHPRNSGRSVPNGFSATANRAVHAGGFSSQTAATRAANFPAGWRCQRPAGASWGEVLGAVVLDLWPVWLAIAPALLIEAAL